MGNPTSHWHVCAPPQLPWRVKDCARLVDVGVCEWGTASCATLRSHSSPAHLSQAPVSMNSPYWPSGSRWVCCKNTWPDNGWSAGQTGPANVGVASVAQALGGHISWAWSSSVGSSTGFPVLACAAGASALPPIALAWASSPVRIGAADWRHKGHGRSAECEADACKHNECSL